MIDFIASETHYIDHLAPVWHALPSHARGSFVCRDGASTHVRALGIQPEYEGNGTVVVTASWSDMGGAHSSYQKRVMLEHGIGQTYIDVDNPHYAGGSGRGKVDLFLLPNERCERVNQAAYPEADHLVIGSPRLDELRDGLGQRELFDVAVSFHWDSDFCPEISSAFRWAQHGVAHLPYAVLGHAHPRLWPQLKPWYHEHDLASTWSFEQVARLSAAYCCDNSSTIYEFAALGKPVVLLNPPQYRRHVNHGLRFWEYADVGVQVNDPDDLAQAVDTALSDPAGVAARRAEIVGVLFPHQGVAAQRAAGALVSLL